MATSVFAASGVYSYTLNSIDGKPAPLAEYKGKVVLIVNVASQCGYTPQYSALEAIYEKYKDQGFVILGFPANNFGAQEPGTNEEIKTFSSRQYGVTFPMFSKISVKGADQAPLYSYLTKQTGPGISGDIKWNFTKFLVDRSGSVVQRFEPPGHTGFAGNGRGDREAAEAIGASGAYAFFGDTAAARTMAVTRPGMVNFRA
jgi:glutathione peroxidase